MNRAALPNRRRNVTVDALWQDHQITVTVGFNDAGNPAEVFCTTQRGGAMAASLADVATIISIALQHGIAPASLAKSLGRVPAWINGVEADAPASPVGTIIAVLIDAATQDGTPK